MSEKAIDDATRNDGGCAFPFVSHGGVHEHQYVCSGMSMRDYFAAQALNGAISTLGDFELSDGLTHERFFLDVAQTMYEWADAMITAREVAQ